MVLGFVTAFFISLLHMIESGESATLIFAGDAMAHQGQLDAARQPDGTYSFDSCYSALIPEVQSADFAVVNLETTLGAGRFTGYPCFCSPDTFAAALRNAGFDLFLTANNHTLDRLDSGLRRTISVLDQMGINHIGTYYNKEHRDTVLPFIANINGIRVGFLNYTYGTNGIKAKTNVVVDYIDTALIAKDIRSLRNNGAELLAVAMHWGVEYKLSPHPEQQRLAKWLCDKGVEMVIGGHPHVVQPMEMRTGKDGRKHVVAFSLGNFISNMKTADTRKGAMAKVHISRGKDGVAQVDTAYYLPIRTIQHPNFKVAFD